MAKRKGISKVTPISVLPAKENNFLMKGLIVARQLKILIFAEAFMGINRLHLLQYKLITRIGYLNSLVLICFALFNITIRNLDEGFYLVFKDTACLEYILLVLTTTLQRKKIERLFRNLDTFDEMLNITKDIGLTSPAMRNVVWIFISVIYSVAEYILLVKYVLDKLAYTLPIVYLTVFVHDSEHLLFCSLLRTILMRVLIVKAHIAKEFNVGRKDSKKKKIDKIGELAKNAKLDTTGMHRAYELLHHCSDQLNSIMSFPIIIMLFTSGLSTILLAKNIFHLAQSKNWETGNGNAMVIYAGFRFMKYTLLVVIPCYYSSVTNSQVSRIRTMLHDAMSTFPLDKFERRKMKAFFQMTQDDEFSYALWGVIKLNMSLPLSYSSLCTTYLVIIIQFSKFID